MPGKWITRIGLGAIVLTILAGAGCLLGPEFLSGRSDQKTPAANIAASELTHKFLADEWSDRISSDTFWRGRPNRSSNSSPALASRGRSNLQGPPPDASWFLGSPIWDDEDQRPNPSKRGAHFGAGGYRTVCVRTCDGSFFPISFGASEAQFSRDQTTCSNACPGARLFYYRASGEDPDDMVDLSGQRYSKMPNANLFRTQYVEACKCKPHPWEQQAVERHRIYALEDQKRKGNRAVVAELQQLKEKSLRDRMSTPVRTDSRKNERQRRKATAEPKEVHVLQPQTTVQASIPAPRSPAPRSDAARGQGGERWADATDVTKHASAADQAAPAAPAVAPTRTASAAASVSAAAVAVTASIATSASASPARSPIAAAAASAILPAGPALTKPALTEPSSPTTGAPAFPARYTAQGPAANLGIGPAPAEEVPPGIQPDAMPSPEVSMSSPHQDISDSGSVPDKHVKARGGKRSRNAAVAYGSRLLPKLGNAAPAANRRVAEQSTNAGSGRSSDWARRVFNP